MASSRKSNLVEQVAARLAPHIPPYRHILIGLSGGMDSVVLLHLLATIAPRYHWQLSALHVHHGISPHAETWAAFCTGLCSQYGLSLHIERVDITPLRDDHGVEAAARQLRHAAFLRHPCDFLALAHHADDQTETLLLQLLRGAGLRGAAAMPQLKPATPTAHAIVRPLLDIPRSQLRSYAQAHQLQWVEDESNADDHYPRNFLRHRLLPVLEERFPAYRDTLGRSAQHFAEAAALLDELAQQDGAPALQQGTLSVEALRALRLPRARNLLRYYLHQQGAPMPQAVQLDDMLGQLLEAREDAQMCVEYGGWQIRRYRDQVHILRSLADFEPVLTLPWQGEAELYWPPLAQNILFAATQGQGISLHKLQHQPVTLRLRSGGETLRPHPRAAARSLKNLLQEHGIPPWQRERLPLLYCGEELVCVVGVAVQVEYRAEPDEAALLLSCTHLDYDGRSSEQS